MKTLATLQEFDDFLKEADPKTLIVIDFYADWCGPCKMIAPKLLEMEKNYSNVLFCKVNVDDNEDAAVKCDIRVMPTFLFYKDSKKVDELAGANETAIKQKVEQLM